jgi:hypothetical protein
MVPALLLWNSVVQQKLEYKLAELKPVTSIGATSVSLVPTSLGGVVVQNSVGVDTSKNGLAATLVYSIPTTATSFRALFGVPDSDNTLNGEGVLTVYIDGEVFKEYRATGGVKPVRIEAPLNRNSSLKLVFEGPGAIGNPVFSNLVAPGSKQETSTPSTPSELPRVILLAPENGERAKDKVTFKWEKIQGAVAYGIEIVMISNQSTKTPTRFLRAFTSNAETFEWNFSDDVVNGEYQASVIAFSKKGVCSRFSASRKFKIERSK